MNLELTDEQIALRDSVRRYLVEKAPIREHVRPLLDDDRGTTDEVWSGLARLGATGLVIPEEGGGGGASMMEAGIVLEELGRALHPGPWMSSAVVAARALTRVDGSGGAAKLLGGIADGSLVVTVFLPDLQYPAARLVSRGDEVLVSAEPGEVPDGMAADVILVPATNGATGGATGGVLVAVEASGPGIDITPAPGVDPTRKRSRVALDGAPATRLGPFPSDQVRALGDDLLIASAADALGAAQTALELVLDHARTRTQFGQPIGSFQAVQHLCVDMYETVELFRSGVLEALWAADAASSEERHLAALRLKAFAGQLAIVGETAIQVLGGTGYTWDHDAHLYLKRLLGWSALYGSSDRYLEQLGRHLAQSLAPEGAAP